MAVSVLPQSFTVYVVQVARSDAKNSNYVTYKEFAALGDVISYLRRMKTKRRVRVIRREYTPSWPTKPSRQLTLNTDSLR